MCAERIINPAYYLLLGFRFLSHWFVREEAPIKLLRQKNYCMWFEIKQTLRRKVVKKTVSTYIICRSVGVVGDKGAMRKISYNFTLLI